MYVTRRDGHRVKFDADRIKQTIARTGAGDVLIEKVLSRVASKMTDGITTEDLLKLVKSELIKDSVCFSCRYSLKEAIMKMGPAGFNFEYYVAEILKGHGYNAHVPMSDFEGACVSHEVDVVAEKDNRRIFIEAKFRNTRDAVVDLKDIMATWSRFLDLVDGASVGKCPYFDEVWVVTNARFTEHALKFAQCKGMHLTGWDYPKEFSFGQMVDRIFLYPVTVVDDLSEREVSDLAKGGFLLCKDVLKVEVQDLAERLDWDSGRVEQLSKKCSLIIEGE
jgi:Holliday junction resolvase